MVRYVIGRLLKRMMIPAVRNSKLGLGSKIEAGSSFINSTIGKHSFCGYSCDINCTDIGAYCSIASNVVIGGGAHPIDWVSTSPVFYAGRDSIKYKASRHQRDAHKRTVIGDDVWIGQNSLIKQGVVIGTGAVIGMGSVVTKDVKPYSVVAGNPAKLIRSRFSEDLVSELISSCWWEKPEAEIAKLAAFIKNPEKFLVELRKTNK